MPPEESKAAASTLEEPEFNDASTHEAYELITTSSARPAIPPAAPPDELAMDWDSPPQADPTESIADDAPALGGKATLRWEPVNVHLVSEALKLDAIRRVPLEYYNAFDVLLSIQRRANGLIIMKCFVFL